MAHDTEKLRELLERCERLEGGRDLNFEGDLLRALLGENLASWPAEYRGLSQAPTASLDASIALVERMLPGVNRVLRDGEPWGNPSCTLSPLREPHGRVSVDGAGVTLPLAVLCALLRALISQAEGEAQHGPRA